MSVTTTKTRPTYSIARTLADYELHHSEPRADAAGEAAEPASQLRSGNAVQGNPPTWETDWRRVPPYRPVNRELDVASRSITLNAVETFFVYNMFHGIQIVEVCARKCSSLEVFLLTAD